MSEVPPVIESSTLTAGKLALGVLPGLLREIYVNRRTGTLHLTREDQRGTVCFINGSIVFGGANIPECMMGETFVRHGLLTREQLAQALEASHGPAKRLGHALLELGFMDRSALDQALALHVREILQCVFSWPDGAYAFEEQDPRTLAALDRPLPLSTAEVILDAVWSVADSDVIRKALGDLDRVLVPASDPLLRFQRVELTPDDGFVLSRVDRTLTAREIIQIASTSSEEAERSLFGLLSVGMIDFAPSTSSGEPACPGGESGSAREELAPAVEETGSRGEGPSPAPAPEAMRRSILETHAALAGRDHYEVLGISRRATPAALKAAYFRLVRKFHPDAQHDPVLADLRGRIEAIFVRVNAAHDVLANPASRAAYDASLPAARSTEPESPSPSEPEERPVPPADGGAGPGRVETVLGAADEKFAGGDYWGALQLAHSIVADAEGALKQRARMLAARVYLKHPERAKEAEDELRAAVQEDRHNAEAFYLLGTLYEAAGTHDRAEMMFRKALAIDPRHLAARAKLGGTATAERPDRGVLGRLFGRS